VADREDRCLRTRSFRKVGTNPSGYSRLARSTQSRANCSTRAGDARRVHREVRKQHDLAVAEVAITREIIRGDAAVII